MTPIVDEFEKLRCQIIEALIAAGCLYPESAVDRLIELAEERGEDMIIEYFYASLP